MQTQTEQSSNLGLAGLEWSDQLVTGNERMDHTHEEFVTMLNALLITPPTEQLNLYRAFLTHTVEHFTLDVGHRFYC